VNLHLRDHDWLESLFIIGNDDRNGTQTKPWEILYFKAYKSQLPVIEQARQLSQFAKAAVLHRPIESTPFIRAWQIPRLKGKAPDSPASHVQLTLLCDPLQGETTAVAFSRIGARLLQRGMPAIAFDQPSCPFTPPLTWRPYHEIRRSASDFADLAFFL
jgi:hypothetical protein